MYDPQKHHRHSIRLRGYDYATRGAYFVTICVKDPEDILGEAAEGQILLNDLGRIAESCWRWLGEQHDYIVVDEFVVMPNHLHGVLFVEDHPGGCGSRTAQAGSRVSRKPIGRLIAAFKTVSTKRINGLRGMPGAPFWQRNYYERIVRDDEELNRIRRYIIDNPANWEQDEENRRHR